MRRRELELDADAFPEGDAVLDFSGRGLRVRVIPGGVVVANAVHFEMV